jgi:hypothetical protein
LNRILTGLQKEFESRTQPTICVINTILGIFSSIFLNKYPLIEFVCGVPKKSIFMKFWQLVAITRNDFPDLITRLSNTNILWENFANNFSDYVRRSDRLALDSIVKTEFLVALLDQTKTSLYLSSDNWLRSWKFVSTDSEV